MERQGILPVLDLLCHCQESLLDIRGILCGCLKEGDGQLIGEFLYTEGISRRDC